MNPAGLPGLDPKAGLLIDTNLLVLLAVGSVNRNRIENFKRTRQYTKSDYDLLVRIVGKRALYTVAHVMAEVSNLTDLKGGERLRARQVLAETLVILQEPHVPSILAAGSSPYESLGLTDSAITQVAREHLCTVLTDDWDLYHSLSREKLPVYNFTHLRQYSWDNRDY